MPASNYPKTYPFDKPKAKAGRAPKERRPLPRVVWYLLILLLFWGGWQAWKWHGDYAGAVANSPPPNATIYMLGDSMTAGEGADPGKDLPTQIGQRLHRTILNGGVDGETTGSVQGRVPQMLALHPGTVIISLGGNDVLRGVPETEAEHNLAAIIQAAQAQGAMVVLVGISGKPFDGYDAMYAHLARQYHCVLAPDVLSGIFFDARYKADEIHPNSAGYGLMADRIAERMEKYL